METYMSGAMVIEGALLSFLLALWMTWIGLRGLFWLVLFTSRPATSLPCREPDLPAIPFRRERAASNAAAYAAIALTCKQTRNMKAN